MRKGPYTIELNPFWFKVHFSSRRVINDKQVKHVGYTSGHDALEVKRKLQESNPGWIVKIKEIEYDQVVKEISGGRS